MADRTTLLEALGPVLEALAQIDPDLPDAADRLQARLPLAGTAVRAVEALVREGAADGWLCPKGEPGMRFGRVTKPLPETHDFAVDAVDMARPGPGHTHPRGELNLCFALEGDPRFDGQAPGWVVLPSGSWHIPTVSGGRMAILYFLPGGAFQMGPSSPAGQTR